METKKKVMIGATVAAFRYCNFNIRALEGI